MIRKSKKTFRKKNWDYRTSGNYFITICSRNKIPYFGENKNGKIILSEIGMIAQDYWLQIPKHFPNICLGEFIVMPDHIHGILMVNNDYFPNPNGNKKIENNKIPDDQSESGEIYNKCYYSEISPKPFSVIVVIRSYKSAVSRRSNLLGFEFKWQKNFYDHYIDDDFTFQQISKYIKYNPIIKRTKNN